MSDYSNQPAPRPPVDPRGAHTPPPPPPPGYAYGYPPAPPAEKKSMFGGLTKIGGVISMAFLLFFVGFYTALIVMNQNTGPRASLYQAGEGDAKIAILPIDGVIMSDAAVFVRQVVDQLIEDESVKAVVLRVDSPGGAVTPSDEIYRHLKRLKAERDDIPIVASYGSVAASGGYYVSCGADHIFIQPTSLTGSIGVLGQVFTLGDMMDKIGVDPLLITSTESTQKDVANNTFRAWNEQDIEKMRAMLDVMYDQFIDVVHEGRAAHFESREAVNAVAHGQVYTAQASIDAKLTDEIGYLDAAIEKARELGGISEKKPPVVLYSQPVSFSALFGVSGPSNGGSAGGGWSVDLNVDAATVRKMLTELTLPEPAYLMRP